MPHVEALLINLLGAPQLTWRGQPFDAARRQVRGLLFYLAHVPEPASRDRLAFLFWPDLPDLDARRNLKRLLSTLRGALPDGSLLSAGRGAVGLDRARVWCDAAAFGELVEAADPAAWAQAVDLYRGPFLDGFTLPDCPEYGQWQLQVQAQTEQRYLATLSRLIDAGRAAGELDAAAGYALRYLAVDDLAEDVHRRLIELHGARGDRSAAARQFEQCAMILERELGVGPLPETRAAYETAFAAQPLQQPARPRWAVLPSLALPLIGREDAWQTLAEAHGRLRGGGLILITGEPGVGKSRLMREFATASGALVLAGASPAGAETAPYTAIAAALRQALSSPGRWRAIPPVWLAETGRLLPEVSELFPNLPQPVAVEPAEAQARLFEALARCLRGLAREGPVLLGLDDLHQADAATLGWLAGLPRQLAGSPICLLATCRAADAGRLAEVKRAFARPGLLAEIPLSSLSVDAVARLLAHLPQRPPDLPRLAARLHHATGGNPFFVLETLRALLEDGRLADPPEQLPLAPTVQAAIQRRLDRLSPLGRQALEAAAVLAPDMAFDLVQAAAGRSDLETAQGLDELAGRQLLVDGGALRFNHDLVRQVVYGAISPWRRRILHRRAAEAYDARPAQGEPAWAVVAGHYEQAGDDDDAIRCLEQAALVARRLHAHQEAIDYVERALALGRNTPAQSDTEARLQELLGDSLMARGQHEAAERAYDAALARRPTEQRLARAALQRKVADSLKARMLVAEAEASVSLALNTLGAPAPDWPAAWQHAWLDSQLSLMGILYLRGDYSALSGLTEAIKPTLASIGTKAHRIDYLQSLAELAVRREHFTLSTATVESFAALLAAAQQTDDVARTAWAQFGLGFGLLWSDRTAEAAAPLLAGLALAGQGGLAYTEVLCLTYLACAYRFLGDTVEARRYAERSLAASRQVDMPIYRAAAHANLAALGWRAGQVAAAQAEAERALGLWGDFAYPFRWLANWVLLAVHTARGELATGVAQAQAILHPGQRRQPGDLPALLENAVRAWSENPDEARAALRRAIELAQGEGYL